MLLGVHMKKLIFVVFTVLILLITIAKADDKTHIYFFYGKGCPVCSSMEPFLHRLEDQYISIDVGYYEVRYNQTNRELFEQFCAKCGTKPYGVPMTFINKKSFIGFDKNIALSICDELGITECPVGDIGDMVSKDISLPIAGIVFGLADGVNPCLLAVMLFLLAYSISTKSLKRTFVGGAIFISIVFVVNVIFMYLLHGGVTLIAYAGYFSILKTIIGVCALFVAAIMIKDFIWYERGFSFKLPKFIKSKSERFIKTGTIPAIIFLAAVVNLAEITCSPIFPLAYVTMLEENVVTTLEILAYLIWYNIFYVISLIILLIIIYSARTKVEKLEKWRLKTRKYMRLVAGLILLFLGIMFLLGLI